jgi:hypothetical protein
VPGIGHRLFARNHQVRVLDGRTDETLRVGPNGLFVLFANRFGRAAALGHVAREAALEAHVEVRPDVHLRVESATQLAHGPGAARVFREGVGRLLERAAGRQRQKVLVRQFPLQRAGMVEVLRRCR